MLRGGSYADYSSQNLIWTTHLLHFGPYFTRINVERVGEMPPSFTRGIFTIPLESMVITPGVKREARGMQKAANGKPFVRDVTIPG